MTEKLLFTRKESAEILSISIRQLDYLLSAGSLPSRRLGRKRLIPRAALEVFARRDHAPPHKKTPNLERNNG